MTSIFWDLETTDLNDIGQIINYCFIEVDEDWEVLSECIGEIKVNRLQLPRAGAICATKTNILDHQARANETEVQAMKKISQYLAEAAFNNATRLIGFNNFSFDIPFFRTSFMRNGLSPYVNGLKDADLYLLAQDLWCTNEKFQELITSYCENKEIKHSLRLEVIAKALGLLSGEQDHESKSDVLLTINVARELFERFGKDIRDYSAYQASDHHEQGSLVNAIYYIRQGVPYSGEFIFYKQDGKASWWINLKKYQEISTKKKIDYRECLKRIKNDGSLFLLTSQEKRTYEGDAIAKINEFVDLAKFYDESSCDIEMFIYGLSFPALKSLYKNLYQNTPDKIKFVSAAEEILYKRYRMANSASDLSNTKLKEALKEYGQYRYGGNLIISNDGKVHPTLDEMYSEIEQAKLDNPDNLIILDALKQFYDSSEIVQVLKDGAHE